MKDYDMMTRERLGALFDAYGGDLRRWPEPSRAAADAFMARNPAARQLLDQALALDALLDQASMPSPSRALRTRVIGRARPPVWRQSLAALWPFGPAWQPAAAFALIAMLGVALGPFINQTELTAYATSEIETLGLGGMPDEGDLP